MSIKRRSISLNDAKKMQLEMLKHFHNFCVENNITYFLAYGTLIGAIRHKGYIPWDDDVDVMIPQPEFEKLMKIYKSERYPILYWLNNKEHPYPFARIYDNNTYKLLGNHDSLGLFVDMYIIYGAPDGHEARNIYFNQMRKYTKINDKLCGIRSRLCRYGLWPSRSLDFKLLNLFCKHVVSLNAKYKYEDHEDSYIHCGAYLKVYPRSIFESSVLVSFDNYQFFAPVGYDKFLRITYGDYMQLPPENKRIPNHGNGDCFLKEEC